ncbi:hypothetical protein BH24CHL5_BH24CHL5_12250 [soil metagenome]
MNVMQNHQPGRVAALGLVLAATLAIAACNVTAGVNLDGREYVSTSITIGGQGQSLVAGTRVHASFANGRFSVSAGCNTIVGEYRIDGGQMVVGQTSTTEMGCDRARHEQDELIAAFLGGNPNITVNEPNLILSSGGAVLTLTDIEVAQPDLELTGRTWRLTSILSGDAVASVPEDVSATLAFGEWGRVDIEPGCNSAGSNYAVDGDRIDFGDIDMTLMLCGGPRGDVETDVLKVLNEPQINYHIDGSTLTLDAGQFGLIYTADET